MRSLETAKKQIRRTPNQALAAIIVLSVTFFLGNIFSLIALGSQATLSHFETRPQVIAYLKEDVTGEQIVPLQQEIQNTNLVENIKYVSKEEALAIYKESVNNDPLLLGSITDLSTITADILPASLEISVKNPDNFPAIISILEKSDLVDNNSKGEKDIDFPQDIVDDLTAWTKGIRTGGLVIILAQITSSILTIAIIISMKARSRRTEIQTMQLLGAKNSFISTPYMFESVLYSLAGAAIGWSFAYIALLYATPLLAPLLSGIISFPVSPVVMLMVLLGSLIVALILGVVSSVLAVGRFLGSK